MSPFDGGQVALALGGSAVLAAVHWLVPPVQRLPERIQAWLRSFSGGAGLSYVLLYLLFQLTGSGAPAIHALLPLTPDARETVFLLLLVAVTATYLVQAHLSKTPGQRDDFLGYALVFLAYNLLAGAGLVEEAVGNILNLAFYVVAISMHMLANALLLHHLDPGSHHRRWHLALAAMPVAGCAAAAVLAPPEGLLYMALALIAGSTVIQVVRQELPSPESVQPTAFLTGAALYTVVIMATWRL